MDLHLARLVHHVMTVAHALSENGKVTGAQHGLAIVVDQLGHSAFLPSALT